VSANCPTCGEELDDGGAFCPHCGARLPAAAGDTMVVPPPPHETGPVPVELMRVEPRYFGIPPASALLAVGAAALAVGVVLLVFGEPVAGAVAVVGGLAAVAAAVDRQRRRDAIEFLRSRAGTIGSTLSARRELTRVRAELEEVERERGARLRALGEAVYGEDSAATESLRRELAELDDRAEEKRVEIERIVGDLEASVARARLETGRTQALEPYPPPDEGDVPEPPLIPEPYPPPDEADPPEQPRIPEPYPQPPPEPPEPGVPPEPSPEEPERTAS
jgi:hypothetical protein